MHTITQDEFAIAFWQQFEHPQQVHVDQRQLPSEKLGNKRLSNSYRCFFLNYSSLILIPPLHEKLKCGV